MNRFISAIAKGIVSTVVTVGGLFLIGLVGFKWFDFVETLNMPNIFVEVILVLLPGIVALFVTYVIATLKEDE